MLTAILLAATGATAASPAAVTRPVSIGAPHFCAENKYPVPAMQVGAEGDTFVKFTITKEGHVTDASVGKPSGNADLDAASVTCVRDWMYQPAMQDGMAVDAP